MFIGTTNPDIVPVNSDIELLMDGIVPDTPETAPDAFTIMTLTITFSE